VPDEERVPSIFGGHPDRQTRAGNCPRWLRRRLTLIDLLEMFPSCQVDLALALELLPAPRPRQYSISSAADGADSLFSRFSSQACSTSAIRKSTVGSSAGAFTVEFSSNGPSAISDDDPDAVYLNAQRAKFSLNEKRAAACAFRRLLLLQYGNGAGVADQV
jgi:hypothetical protein